MSQVNEIEKMILGACMSEPDNCIGVFEKIKPEHFSNRKHEIIYTSIVKLLKDSKAVDFATVIQQTKAAGQLEQIEGGAAYIAKLVNDAPGSHQVETHCLFLIEDFMKRQLWVIGQNLIGRAQRAGADPFELMDEVEKGFQALFTGINLKAANRIDDIRDRFLKQAEIAVTTKQQSGIPNSINALNGHTNGWQKSDLIILAGRPGMGKTSAAVDFALYPALNGFPVAFFSLEMNEDQLMGRILSVISTINVQDIVQNKLDRYKLDALKRDGAVLDGVPLYIEDQAPMTMFQIRNKAKRLKKEKGIEMIIVDYLQLISAGNVKGKSREQEISEISRSLKLLAKELNVPVIALSQLSREVEKRPDKKPQLSDLRDSGSIEQDADMVIFCMRPGYYESIMEYHLGSETITEGLQELFVFIIAKFRNGSCGEIRAKWIGENTAIKNYY
jgi:replicative DNA helicase